MTRNGYSLLELLFAVAALATLSGIAVPPVLAALDGQRTAGAARYIAARIQRIRMEAVSRSTNVALRFVPTASGYWFRVYIDGDGDGVRTDDITQSIDRPLGAIERLPDNFADVDFATLPNLPAPDAGSTPPGTDPIKLGTSDLLSYSALGTCSSGSLYVRGKTTQFVVRVYGDTGRTRILKFDARQRQWVGL